METTLSLFNYSLPEELIAQLPSAARGGSRLLVADSTQGTIADAHFAELPLQLRKLFGAQPILLIANDSRVYPARIPVFKKTGAKGEVLLLDPPGTQQEYACLLRPQKKLSLGEILYSRPDELREALFEVTSFNPPSVRPLQDIHQLLSTHGVMPLPPYIRREPTAALESEVSELDKKRYQNVYSAPVGSAAAPTAGLHFTDELIAQCQEQQISLAFVTLHVGLGTFQPVQTSQIAEHQMHEEHYRLSAVTLQKIARFVTEGWPIVFVGTTALRACESFFTSMNWRRSWTSEQKQNFLNHPETQRCAEQWRGTRLFIYPKDTAERYLPAVGQGIITNFHQPESTLVMLIAALMGYEFWKSFYDHAIAQRYRFFSYGDSSLLRFFE